MSNKKKEEEFNRVIKEYVDMHGHKPVSRRDFLGAGLIGFSGMVMGPALATLIGSPARAAQCAATGDAGMAPIITLNLSGGSMMASDFVPMDAGGQMLSSYNKMGLGEKPTIIREFGNVPFAGDGISKLLEGIKQMASDTTIAKTAFVGIPTRARDDSGENLLDISGMVAAAGLAGTDLPGLGRRSGKTGIRQLPAIVTPPNPLIIGRTEDVSSSIGASVDKLGELNDDQRGGLFKLINKLSSRQKERVLSSTGGSVLNNLVECANIKNQEQANKSGAFIDARNDAELRAVWGIEANTNSSDARAVAATMANAALNGIAGSVGFELGGYDYHNNTRTRGDQMDLQAGQYIGRFLETAAKKGQRLMLYVTSDGSCSSPVSASTSAPWRGDRGSAGVMYMIMFDPAGRPKTSNFQIGQFTNAQAADDQFITGGSPELAAAAVFANYLEWNGKLNLLEQIIPGKFTTAQLDKIIVVG